MRFSTIMISAASIFALGCNSSGSNPNTPQNNRQTAVVINSNRERTDQPSVPSGNAPVKQNTPSTATDEKLKISRRTTVTLESFNELETGMTYAEVAKILGSPGSTQGEMKLPGGSMQMYNWKGEGVDPEWSVAVRFDNGKLVSKTQTGLK